MARRESAGSTAHTKTPPLYTAALTTGSTAHNKRPAAASTTDDERVPGSAPKPKLKSGEEGEEKEEEEEGKCTVTHRLPNQGRGGGPFDERSEI